MSTTQTKVYSVLQTMLFTGIILAPAALATPALQDLLDLRSVINMAANTIGDTNNPNRGWGFNLGGGGQMGTADLVNNVTTTILRSKWQLDTNKTMWLLPTNLTNGTDPNLDTAPPALTPTLPLTASLVLPSTLPNSTPTLENITTDLSTPYIDYVSAIPSLSTSLISLGRAYHREMNAPIYQAIAGLQQSLSALQSAMLTNDLIRPNAVIRTLRASSSLEDAQQAWSRFLNLPGTVSAPAGDLGGAGAGTGTGDSEQTGAHSMKGRAAAVVRPPLREGEHYSHQDLWGRKVLRKRQSKEGDSTWYDALVEWEERRGKQGLKARMSRLFVA
ncbi:hypothetical protein T440DRAFT_487246 [Plenodomus tracheiphilus IPT5]|uniref:Uncharacterized protein n=1 Tax=Plenodomus tracheiphilus IPT5 TaxID=1408161 RepID=A0A6A7BHU5_9PLEO|nr:hypothetical protein T440DRAFT_487246 [Plenodomus tracheiphilus IPT5]